MSVDLTFRNNQNWLLVYDVSLWDVIYDFTKVVLRMQIRQTAEDAQPVYSFSSVPLPGTRGTITYQSAGHVVVAQAPYADVRTYMPAGSYVHDMTIEVDDPLTGKLVVLRDIADGGLTVTDGVTLR